MGIAHANSFGCRRGSHVVRGGKNVTQGRPFHCRQTDFVVAGCFFFSLAACATPPRATEVGVPVATSPVVASTTVLSETATPPLPELTQVTTSVVGLAPNETTVPTPDLAASTVPELDSITISNAQPLVLPEETVAKPLGLLVWSPDGQHFLANVISDESVRVGQAGYSLLDLYQGDATTGVVSLVLKNAGWPAWSRDGRSIYYLSAHGNDDRVQYDLYKMSLVDGTSQLVFADVGDPGTQPVVAETADGRLVLLDRDYQASLLDQGTLAPIADLAGLPASAGAIDNFSLAPDGVTLAILSQGHPIYIVDLATEAPIGTVNATVSSSSNVAWSEDSNRLAYATPDGITVHDVRTNETYPVASRGNLGIPSNDPTTSFEMLAWSADQQTLLFAAATDDWMRRGTVGQSAAYQFASTVDGTHWKALSDAPIVLSPQKNRAIASQLAQETGREQLYLVDVTWK